MISSDINKSVKKLQDNTKSDIKIITNQTNENTLSIENVYQFLRAQINNNPNSNTLIFKSNYNNTYQISYISLT